VESCVRGGCGASVCRCGDPRAGQARAGQAGHRGQTQRPEGQAGAGEAAGRGRGRVHEGLPAGADQEREQYEIESINSGLGLDVNYKPDGTLLVVEEEVRAADVPAAVMAAITARYPQAKIVRPERATERGTISYEISVKGAPVKSVQLTPEGKWISPKPGK
jgi:hypothetical protein